MATSDRILICQTGDLTRKNMA